MSIYRAIKEEELQIDLGDVIVDIYFAANDERVNAVVITPACDLVQKKADYIKFVATVPYQDIICKLLTDNSRIDTSDFESVDVLSRTKYNSAVKALKSNINGDLLPRYYLIPAYPDDLPESFLDFQKVFTIPIEEVYRQYSNNRAAKIASPWREQIVTRYNGYSVRVGAPDYTEYDLRELLHKAGLNLPPMEETQ
ncbi:MAG: hypothetical protein HQ553_04420 [Chloroflexi bacterium]|nr:hypothetical protein [Chloroflexota bacterium]